MAQRRNPYFVLGLDHGAGPEQAQAAFARLSRRLRRDPQAAYGIEDATWALHEIEHAATDPSADLGVYRVPANPAAYDYPPAPGVLSPPPRNLPRRTGPSDGDVARLQADVVHELGGAALATLAGELAPPAAPDPVPDPAGAFRERVTAGTLVPAALIAVVTVAAGGGLLAALTPLAAPWIGALAALCLLGTGVASWLTDAVLAGDDLKGRAATVAGTAGWILGVSFIGVITTLLVRETTVPWFIAVVLAIGLFLGCMFLAGMAGLLDDPGYPRLVSRSIGGSAVVTGLLGGVAAAVDEGFSWWQALLLGFGVWLGVFVLLSVGLIWTRIRSDV